MLPAPSFHVIGLSHHTAPVEVRERLAFSSGEAAALLAHDGPARRSGLLLSTCNRTEVYWSGDADLEPWFRDLARLRGAEPGDALYRYDGGLAARHLFTVAAGLDSQILGESEILGQVRRACEIARAAGSMTREMTMIFGAAINAGRRVRRETRLGRHPASVSSAAVDTGLGLVSGRSGGVLVIGAGEVARGVLHALHERGVGGVVLVTRNHERAATLAGTWGVETRRWAELAGLLASVDVCFVATAAKRPCLTAALLAEVAAARGGRELVMLDLSVPRNVEPASRSLDGIRLLDLDDLQRLRCPAGDADVASTAVAHAEQVLVEELARLDLALRSRALAPRLAELHRIGGEIAEREAAWALAQLDGLSERERKIVREMAQRLVRRVLYPVSRSIRLDEAPDESEEPLSA